MKQNTLYSILLLFTSILISLIFSIMLQKPTIEGMTTSAVQNMISQIILNPGTSDVVSRLNAIKQLVLLMDNLSDQNNYSTILQDTNLSDEEKLTEITDLINTLLKTNIDPGQIIDA